MLIFIFSLLFPERPLSPQVIMGSHIATYNSPLAVFYQPALLPGKLSFAFTYTKPYEGLPINFFESAVSFPLFKLNLGLGFSYFGEEIYKENLAILSLSYKNSLFSVGSNLKLLSLYIPEVISHNEPSLDFGTVLFFPFDIKIGAFTRNFYRSKNFKTDIPSLFALSFGVTHKTLEFFFDLLSEENHPFTYSIGFKINILKSFYLRGGLKSEEKILGVGFGINPGFVSLEGFYRVHPFLGSSFALSISFYKN
ncbi:MAG: hypothetical protein ABDH37_01575 [Candidatus Hydrothermales bacterium]